MKICGGNQRAATPGGFRAEDVPLGLKFWSAVPNCDEETEKGNIEKIAAFGLGMGRNTQGPSREVATKFSALCLNR